MHDMALLVSLTMYKRTMAWAARCLVYSSAIGVYIGSFIMRTKFSFVHLRCVRGSRTQQTGRAIEGKKKGRP